MQLQLTNTETRAQDPSESKRPKADAANKDQRPSPGSFLAPWVPAYSSL